MLKSLSDFVASAIVKGLWGLQFMNQRSSNNQCLLYAQGGAWFLVGLVINFHAIARAADPPRLRIEPAGKVDLGSLGPRERKAQRYTFTNTSGAPIALRVFDLAPGLRVEGPALRQPIPAGARATLDLWVDATDWVGFQARNVRLGTDDPGQGTYYLPTAMVVRPDLTVPEARKDFGDVRVPGSPQETFRFVRETGAPVVLRVPQALPPYLELEQDEGQGSASLSFSLRSQEVPPGVTRGFERIQVETNVALEPRFDLYLSWRIRRPVEAAPSRLVFQNDRDRSLPLALDALSGRPFRILKAEVEGPGFRVTPPASTAAPHQALTILRTARAPARALLTLTFQGDLPPLQVPLSYLP